MFPFLFWLDQPPWDQHSPSPLSVHTLLLCHQDHFVLCAERSGCPSVFIFAKPAVPLAAVCVCTRVCVCARVYTCVRASICSFITYLLSAHYVPGTVAEFLWVCLLMLPLLLWGPLSVLSLSPNCYLFVSLGVSGSVHPCVCFSPSLSLCRTLYVSLSLPWCLTLPLCLLITLGL